jgi:hypothetical protein
MLRNDLSAASLKFEDTASRVNIYDILKSNETGFVKTYEFYSFAEPKSSGDKFEKKLNKIVYEFDGEKNTLTRTIYYADSTGRPSPDRTIVLSKEINHFELLAVLGDSHGIKKSFFRPFFQVIEPAKKKEQAPAIREFMTTIIPHTFNSILEFSGYNRNYNTDPK